MEIHNKKHIWFVKILMVVWGFFIVFGIWNIIHATSKFSYIVGGFNIGLAIGMIFHLLTEISNTHHKSMINELREGYENILKDRAKRLEDQCNILNEEAIKLNRRLKEWKQQKE